MNELDRIKELAGIENSIGLSSLKESISLDKMSIQDREKLIKTLDIDSTKVVKMYDKARKDFQETYIKLSILEAFKFYLEDNEGEEVTTKAAREYVQTLWNADLDSTELLDSLFGSTDINKSIKKYVK